MKKYSCVLNMVICSLTFASSDFVLAGELENGIYELLTEGGTKATRSLGGDVHLGAKLSDEFGDARMWSTSNRNDRFRLELANVGQFDMSGRFAIVVDGVCEVVGSHTDPADRLQIDLLVMVYGRENANRVAKHFGVKPKLREHPGHLLSVTFAPTENKCAIGGPVEIELIIENVGEKTARFMDGGQQRGARNNQFSFVTAPPLPDTGDPMNFGGIAAFRELQPGEVFRKRVDITKWFRFKKPATYQITGLFELEFFDQENTRTTWDEIVAGRCSVTLTDKE